MCRSVVTARCVSALQWLVCFCVDLLECFAKSVFPLTWHVLTCRLATLWLSHNLSVYVTQLSGLYAAQSQRLPSCGVCLLNVQLTQQDGISQGFLWKWCPPLSLFLSLCLFLSFSLVSVFPASSSFSPHTHAHTHTHIYPHLVLRLVTVLYWEVLVTAGVMCVLGQCACTIMSHLLLVVDGCIMSVSGL